MPKNSTLVVLKRLRAMDRELRQSLRIDEFARRMKVSIKTVRRDLKVLETILLKDLQVDQPERFGEGKTPPEVFWITEGDKWHKREWRYARWVTPLFSRNKRPAPTVVGKPRPKNGVARLSK